MSSLARRMVYVYSGLGTTPLSLQMLTKALTTALDGTEYTVQQLGAEEIKRGEWQGTTALLSIGGGYDKGVIEALGREGLSLVRSYVEAGGSYLGLCSGGYLACSSIQFDRNGPLEVCGERPLQFFLGGWEDSSAILAIGGGFGSGVIQALGETGITFVRNYVLNGGSYLGLGSGGYLGADVIVFDRGGPLEKCRETDFKFFPGSCIGPVFPRFVYNSESGAHATPLTWTLTGKNKSSPFVMDCYFNGGGYFEPQGQQVPDCTDSQGGATVDTQSHLVNNKDSRSFNILATYKDTPGDKAAVVKCNVGEGTAVLSGVHLEFLYQDLDKTDQNLRERNVVEKLENSEALRQTCFREVLQTLGLHL